MSGPGNGPWLKLSEREVRAMMPYTLRCSDLDAKAVKQVRRSYCEMVGRSLDAFFCNFGRVPDEAEAGMLARAIVQHLNSNLIPSLGGRGNGHATLQ